MPRLRPAPWWVVLELANLAHHEWRELPAADRDKLTRLAVKSRGLPTNLTPRERAEVKRILGRVDLKRVARDLVPKAVRRRGLR
jgi:hypothetical protein